MKPLATIAELEAILNEPDPPDVSINPDGTITVGPNDTTKIAMLRAALEPFAKAARCAEPDEDDDYCLAGSSARHELTLGDLRHAAKILNGPTGSD